MKRTLSAITLLFISLSTSAQTKSVTLGVDEFKLIPSEVTVCSMCITGPHRLFQAGAQALCNGGTEYNIGYGDHSFLYTQTDALARMKVVGFTIINCTPTHKISNELDIETSTCLLQRP